MVEVSKFGSSELHQWFLMENFKTVLLELHIKRKWVKHLGTNPILPENSQRRMKKMFCILSKYWSLTNINDVETLQEVDITPPTPHHPPINILELQLHFHSSKLMWKTDQQSLKANNLKVLCYLCNWFPCFLALCENVTML